MITFSDLFANETDRYTDFLPSTTQSSDEIVRQYNNSYGVFTDTHMSRLENGDYVITGSLCRDHQLFCTFVCSLSFGLGTFFRPGGGEPISLNDFLRKYGKIWRLTMLNGDCVCYITQDFALTGVPEVTAESVVNGRKTPVALWTIFRSEYGYYNINDFISECMKSGETLNGFTERLNESSKCTINDFIATGREDRFELWSPSKNISVIFNK